MVLELLVLAIVAVPVVRPIALYSAVLLAVMGVILHAEIHANKVVALLVEFKRAAH